ncbi:hypothetical protein M9H77_27023 [Catharanthus roseus]|uniref:Uncharacterized protein n=1 Tax=Catharanthus roseus TaxID=4058 RepID=A0ACC0ACX0_CATRO|nr:hypothetical protein M9H77_27023 [Catharanthus roseus]
MSISHLVANDPEIPVSNIIQEVQESSESWNWFLKNLREYIVKDRRVCLISDGHKVCRENGSRADTYVSEIYSRQTYRSTYQANFHPVLSENFWRDVPFNLTFYPPNIKNEWGRKQAKRFHREMDYRNPDSPPRCGRCRMP